MSNSKNSQKPVQGAPASRAVAVRSRAPRIKQLPNGSLEIEHEEQLTSVHQQTDRAFAYVMRPETFGFLGEVAGAFQEYEWLSLSGRYVPRVGTTESGGVTLAPLYTNRIPGPLSMSGGSGAANDWSNAFRWIKTLQNAITVAPGGAPEVAGNVAKFVVENFTRRAFLTLGAWGITQGYQQGPAVASENTPGYLVVLSETGSLSLNDLAGEVWVKYRVRLKGPRYGDALPNLQLTSSSTDGGALALHAPLLISGNVSQYNLNGNTIQFLRSGVYDVFIHQLGTDPVADTDGHIVTDWAGNVKTDSAFGSKFTEDALVYEAQATSSMRAAGSATGYMQYFRIGVDIGDRLTIDDLTSGTLTSTFISINPTSMMPMIMPS
jgi:hypothetical protein